MAIKLAMRLYLQIDGALHFINALYKKRDRILHPTRTATHYFRFLELNSYQPDGMATLTTSSICVRSRNTVT
ncbi:hypothetical protein [Nodularia sp. UHCC 0506]|uniref:hypothetical protein n=1 Tax=Nodularia sp. UHCC 0506 TaxID=3110243 RepID=UPI002B21118B|nr:hypothetical protein [Nodularia sp. UHCC 0506]MEA5516995.1 hypothetical protein [Nodularia sp. UHCC 0506]